MADVSTTKMSSKGQVVIPEYIRKQLNLKVGSQFIVLGEKDVIILKNISPPSLDEFSGLIDNARKRLQGRLGLKNPISATPLKKSEGRK